MRARDIPPALGGNEIQRLEFESVASPDETAATAAHHPVVIVGAGPVGLSLAIDLAQRGQRVLVLDNDNRLSTGSRAICFAKRTLEYWDRLGVGDAMVAKGVSWNVGRVYFGADELYRFDLLPDAGHERPAFINLQQYYAEAYLAARADALPEVELRWQNTVTGVDNGADGVTLTVDTPRGSYRVRADWVVACDGARSPVRKALGLESHGRTFRDRFLIADITLDGGAQMPEDRRFWFDPPFHPGQSVLLHKQPDGVWRVDFQLGWDADPEAEKQPERIVPRVRAVLDSIGCSGLQFSIAWASVYTFSCLRMDRFRHGRVLFAGDSAHGVSPFGARGANSGVQDAENLGWKLVSVVGGADAALLDSYADEREYAADENILNSTRATDFITPKSEVSRLFRDAVLDLARDHPFARRLVNSGRLSVPAVLRDSALNTADAEAFDASVVPGSPALDAPLRRDGRATWLLRELGTGFTLVTWGPTPSWTAELGVQVLALDAAQDAEGWVRRRYDLQPGSALLMRPDHHLAARWRQPTLAAVRAALQRAGASA